MKRLLIILFILLNTAVFSDEFTELPVYMFSDEIEIEKDIDKKLENIKIEEKKTEEKKKIETVEKKKTEEKKRKKEKREKKRKNKRNYFYIKMGLKTQQKLAKSTGEIEENLKELEFLELDISRRVSERVELGLGASISGDLEYSNYQVNSETDRKYKKMGISLIPVYLSLKTKTFRAFGIENYIIGKIGYPYIDPIGKNAETNYEGEHFYGIGSGIEVWKIICELNYEVIAMKEKGESFNWENKAFNLVLGFKF